MSTLRFLMYVGGQTRSCIFKQLTQQQQRATCSASWSFQNNRRKNGINVHEKQLLLPLLRPQQFAIPLCNFYPRLASNKPSMSSSENAVKESVKTPAEIAHDDIFAESSKLGLFARFKLMYKKYWYILIPVHCITSLGWFAGFYYLSTSGVDIPTLLTQLHVSETIIEKVKNSSMGHLAIAYLCYKIATPLRYAVTLGGTTVSIKYLVLSGYIKPLPTKQELIDMYEQKKADRAAAKDKEK